MLNGPKKLYRLSWSQGKFPNSEGSRYYIELAHLKKWLSKIDKDGAVIILEQCEVKWERIDYSELLSDS